MCILWGTTYLAIRVAVATWEPFLFGGLRFAAAGTIVILAMRLRGTRVPRDPRLLRESAIAGTLLLVGGNAAVILAERHVPSGITAVMVSTMPIWTVVISAFTPRGHRLGPLSWIGLLGGLAGVVVLVWPEVAGRLPANRDFLLGVVMLQLGSISWAAGSVYVVSRRATVPPLLGAGLQMLAGGIVMILIGTAFGEWARLHPDRHGWEAFLYLLVFGSLLGYVAFVYALQHLPVAKVSLYGYVNPIVAVIVGALILDERFGLREAVATAVVLGAVALARVGETEPT
ncbi:MAG TPA: EamA family transporter [Gemmatimonadaceae bacterium]